jgi:hypothetical protein
MVCELFYREQIGATGVPARAKRETPCLVWSSDSRRRVSLSSNPKAELIESKSLERPSRPQYWRYAIRVWTVAECDPGGLKTIVQVGLPVLKKLRLGRLGLDPELIPTGLRATICQ